MVEFSKNEAGNAGPAIPVIDVGLLRSPFTADRHRVAGEIRLAALDTGFFYIRNHGVSQKLIDRVFERAAAFFALPIDEKMRVATTNGRPSRGYHPMQAIALETGAPPDVKESMTFGLDLTEEDPRVVAGRFDRCPNLWPGQIAGLRETIECYFSEMTELRNVLMCGLALSLGMEEHFFEEYTKEGLDRVALLHYPPQPADPMPGEKGCGAHTDFGGVTILMQDQNGGLQVLDEDSGEWIDAVPMAGAFVVNLGDQIQRWTEGRYRSNMHRVINDSGRERYSVAFFSNGNPDYIIDRLPGVNGGKREHAFEPISVETYLRRRGAEARMQEISDV
ncbi:MAG: 2-oxoglutarate and iron-dependent oxygenase domain-containing protein [Novosphingobium sp.]